MIDRLLSELVSASPCYVTNEELSEELSVSYSRVSDSSLKSWLIYRIPHIRRCTQIRPPLQPIVGEVKTCNSAVISWCVSGRYFWGCQRDFWIFDIDLTYGLKNPIFSHFFWKSVFCNILRYGLKNPIFSHFFLNISFFAISQLKNKNSKIRMMTTKVFHWYTFQPNMEPLSCFVSNMGNPV